MSSDARRVDTLHEFRMFVNEPRLTQDVGRRILELKGAKNKKGGKLTSKFLSGCMRVKFELEMGKC